jgi:hypothetical protein
LVTLFWKLAPKTSLKTMGWKEIKKVRQYPIYPLSTLTYCYRRLP